MKIKFRAWQKNHKRLSRISRMSFNSNNELISACFDNTNNGMYSVAPTFNWYYKDKEEWNLDCLEIEQYTGLKDKNGVEIYEGDIVAVVSDEMYSPIPKDFKGVIVYSEAAFWIDNGEDCAIPVFQEIAELEVIGNIHQHKHLLK